MATVPHWAGYGIESTAWNVCWLGPHFLPGTVKIKCKKSRDIDVAKSPEVDGATATNKGIEPAKVTIRLKLYNNDDAWNAWCEVLRQIDPHNPGSAHQPFDILNPEPNHLGIKRIVILEIESESPDCKSSKEYVIECQQWFPKPKATKSKANSAAKSGGATPDILVPTIGLNGAPNWIEKDQTVKNWVDKDPETGMVPDLPPFPANGLP